MDQWHIQNYANRTVKEYDINIWLSVQLLTAKQIWQKKWNSANRIDDGLLLITFSDTKYNSYESFRYLLKVIIKLLAHVLCLP